MLICGLSLCLNLSYEPFESLELFPKCQHLLSTKLSHCSDVKSTLPVSNKGALRGSVVGACCANILNLLQYYHLQLRPRCL